MKRIASILALAALVVSCGIYSFTGTSIQPDVNTITIPYVEYKALRVNPSLSGEIPRPFRRSSANSPAWSRWIWTETWSWCARSPVTT